MGADVWGRGLTLDAYLAACRDSPKYRLGEWRVLEDERGALVSSLIVYRASDGSAGIGSIATAPDERRRGRATRLIADVLASLDAGGVSRVFLYSDIAPRCYERFGFAALPSEHQSRPGSVCMVRGPAVGELLREPGFRPPSYF
jgi:N-acetylglutamate synthase-like GNAT family acetyltransferase